MKKYRVLKSALFKDSFWALTGNVIGKGLALLASILLARMLGKDIFGMYGLVRTTLLSVAVFSTFGLGYTATKFIAEYAKSFPQKINAVIRNIMQITLVTGLICALLLFIFSKHISAYLDAPDLYNSIRYLAIIVVFNSITTTQIGMLAGFKKFKAMARINLINGLIMFFCSVVLTYFYGLNGALVALLISQVINCIQNYLEVRKSVKNLNVKENDSKYNIRKELISFSLPIASQEMLYSLLQWIMPVLLIKFSDFGELGLFNAAQQWSAVILFIPGTLRNVILSHVSSHADNHSQQVKTLNRMLLINFLATFIPFIVVYLFSGLIVKGYGDSFVSLKSILNVSVFSTIFSCLSGVFKQYFMAINKVWVTFWLRLGNSILVLALFVLIINVTNDGKSALHMAQANVLTQVLFFIILYLLFRKYESKEKIMNN